MKTARRFWTFCGALLLAVTITSPRGRAQDPVPAPVPPEDAAPGDVEPAPEAPVPAPETPDTSPPPEEATPEGEADGAEPVEEEPMLGVSSGEAEPTAADEPPAYELRAAVTPAIVFRSGGTVALLDEHDLARMPLDDPNAVLTRVPGVYIRTEDGFGLRPNIGMRGVNPERSGRVTLMEDGVLFGPAPYSAPAAYYFPLMMRMTGVEVSKGPAAILYGPSTVGGAVNLRTRAVPERAAGGAELLYGMYRSRRMHLHYGASARNAGFLVEASDLGSGGYKHIDGVGGPTGFSRGEYMLRGFVRNDPGAHVHHRVDVRAGYSFERSYETYLGLTRSDFRDDPYRRYAASQRDRMRWHRYEVRLDHTMQIGTEMELVTSLYRNDFQRTWRRFEGFENGPNAFEILLAPASPQNAHFYDVLTGDVDSSSDPSMRTDDSIIVVSNDRTFISEGVQSTFRFDRPQDESRVTGHHLEVGVRLHYDSIVRVHTQRGYLMQNRTLVADGFDDVVETNNHADALALAAFASYALEWKALRVSPGLRTEIIRTELFDYGTAASQVNHQAVLLPGLGVSYELMPWLATFVGVHRGFSPVAPGQTSEVRPESSIAYEAGLRVLDEDSGLTAELSGFYNDYRNLLLSCSAAGGCPTSEIDSQFNAGSANVGGLEAAFANSFDIGHGLSLPVRASYTFTLARFRHVASTAIGTPGYEEAVDGAYVPYIPSHQWQAELGVSHAKFDVTLLVSYMGRFRENAATQDSESLFTDAYTMVDLAGHYTIRENVRLVVRGENLLNQQPLASRRPFGARPAKPLTVMAGIEITL